MTVSIGRVGKISLIVLATILVGLLAAFFSGVLAGLNLILAPESTLTLVIVGYLSGLFNDLTKKQQDNLFLLALLLSFTVSFIQGALTLVLLPPVLKKLKLIAA